MTEEERILAMATELITDAIEKDLAKNPIRERLTRREPSEPAKPRSFRIKLPAKVAAIPGPTRSIVLKPKAKAKPKPKAEPKARTPAPKPAPVKAKAPGKGPRPGRQGPTSPLSHDAELLSPNDVERLYRIDVGTQAQWRQRGEIPYLMLSKRIARYRRQDIERWLASKIAATMKQRRRKGT